jgi:hypothetical protein
MTPDPAKTMIVHSPWCPCGAGLGAMKVGMPVEKHEAAIIQPMPYMAPPQVMDQIALMDPEDKLARWRAAYALERQYIESKWDNLWIQHWEYLYEEEYLIPFWKHGYWMSICTGS